MSRITELFRPRPHPHTLMEEAADVFVHPLRRPYRNSGLLLLILGIVGIVWLFPEIHRYARISRM